MGWDPLIDIPAGERNYVVTDVHGARPVDLLSVPARALPGGSCWRRTTGGAIGSPVHRGVELCWQRITATRRRRACRAAGLTMRYTFDNSGPGGDSHTIRDPGPRSALDG
jgi:hypothetical protein